MKFLVSGDIRRSSGQRLILTIALGFFLAFLAANAALLHLQSGLLPGRIAELNETSLTIRMERAHIQLFFFLLLHLFTASLLVRLAPSEGPRPGRKWVHFMTILGAILTIGYLSFTIWVSSFAFSVSALAVHAWFAGLIVFLLVGLYRKAAERPAPSPEIRRRHFPASVIWTLAVFAALQAISGTALFAAKTGWHPAGVVEYYRGSEIMLDHFPDRPDGFRSPPGLVGRLEIAFAHTFACALLGFIVLHLLQASRRWRTGETGRGRRWIRRCAAIYFASAGASLVLDITGSFAPWWMALLKLPTHIGLVGSILALLLMSAALAIGSEPHALSASSLNARDDPRTE